MELVEGTKYARKCSITGEGMNSGFCIGEGEGYAKDDAALQEHFKWKDADEKQKAYDAGEYYFTTWEMPIEAQYIVKNGELVFGETFTFELEEDITSQRIHELKDEPGVWAFVIANFPNYETSEDIAYVEELRKIIEGGELDKNAQSLFEETFESDLNHVKREYNYMHAKVYGEAIQNFIKPEEKSQSQEDIIPEFALLWNKLLFEHGRIGAIKEIQKQFTITRNITEKLELFPTSNPQ